MNKLLTQKEVCDLLRISYPTLYRWLHAGRFPQPVSGRKRKLLWTQSAVEQWMNRQSMPVNITPPNVSIKQQKREARAGKARQTAARQRLEQHRITRAK